MYVSYRTGGILKGSPEELAAMIAVMRGYDGEEHETFFEDLALSRGTENRTLLRDLPEEDTAAWIGGAEGIAFSGEGPYDDCHGPQDVSLFREMAMAAPKAFFEVKTTGGGLDWTEEAVFCLRGGTMRTKISILDYMEEDDAYRAYALEKVPYERFLRLFGIGSDTFSEDRYRDLMNDLIAEFGEDEEGPFAVSYEEFCDFLRSYGYGAITPDQRTFTAARAEIDDQGMEGAVRFKRTRDLWKRFAFVFDPVTGEETEEKQV